MKVAANRVELFCRIEGQGDPPLLMHGGLGADHTKCKVSNNFAL